MHRNIFRKYDIRGVFKKDFGESDITAIARAISHFTLDDGIAHKNICIGYDGRLSSPIIREALLYGLMECGYSRNSQRVLLILEYAQHLCFIGQHIILII